MTKSQTSFWRRATSMGMVLLAAALFTVPQAAVPAQAATKERSLYLYYTHTKETARIVFKRDGRYVADGLKKLNWFLRDWRRNEATTMSPKLFDLLWEVYEETGSSQPINVVSAYRAPATNAMLRKTSKGVAKNSRHMKGMAMDFFIPGFPLDKLRAIAMKKQIGGVGYYPTSGSPFVHLDVGHVRAWPRMTTAQLKTLFPNGKTMHVPTNGVPLSSSGYKYAEAQWSKCHEVPCARNTFGEADDIRVADNSNGGSKKTIMGMLFGNDDADASEHDAQASVQLASTGAPDQPINRPAARPVLAGAVVADAPFPAALPRFRDTAGAIAVAAIDAQTAPQPRTPAGRGLTAATALAAYASERKAKTGGRPAPRTQVYRTASDPVVTASIAGSGAHDALGDLIESTWAAVPPADPEMAAKVEAVAQTSSARPGVLFAPDFEHVTEIFTDPKPMSGVRYAVIFRHDTADFSPATELGRFAGKANLRNDPAWGLGKGRFVTSRPLLLASR